MAKEIFSNFGIVSPKSRLVSSSLEAAQAASELGLPVAIKAQLPVGGRGKAGAIQKVTSAAEVGPAAEKALAGEIDGLKVASALVETWTTCERELYLAVAMDPVAHAPSLLLAAQGGVDIEALVREGQGSSSRIRIDPMYGLAEYEVRQAAKGLGLSNQTVSNLTPVAVGLYRAYAENDLLLAEINPLGVLTDGSVVALDGKVVADDSAIFRQPQIRRYYELMEPKPKSDYMKMAHNIDYVELDGEIGLISGGAGMTMTAMDLIADAGARPACFMDCSDNATREGYGMALSMLLANPRVKSILVSIFGGLTQMDQVAEALVQVIREAEPVSKPVTVRLEGTNSDKAREILRQHGIVPVGEFKE